LQLAKNDDNSSVEDKGLNDLNDKTYQNIERKNEAKEEDMNLDEKVVESGDDGKGGQENMHSVEDSHDDEKDYNTDKNNDEDEEDDDDDEADVEDVVDKELEQRESIHNMYDATDGNSDADSKYRSLFGKCYSNLTKEYRADFV
jgi:hypothetical protein